MNGSASVPKTPGPAAESRLIDRWFPCSAVDAAVGTPSGSGRSEKALFTWFASRPIAQARAAVLSTLLPDDPALQDDVNAAVRHGDKKAIERLAKEVAREYPDGRPVVLDPFSGRGIIPLEAARLGITAVGTDLSPVATLGGRLLSDFPLRNWSREPDLPFATKSRAGALFELDEPRLLADVRDVLAEVDRRVGEAVADHYPLNEQGKAPWAYLWAVTIPCDNCHRRFPLIGNMVLRHPYRKTDDPGQSLFLSAEGNKWWVDIIEGPPTQTAPYVAAAGKKGKSARCVFPDCRHLHTLDTVKQLGRAGAFSDRLVAVGEEIDSSRKLFRLPTEQERRASERDDYLVDLPTLGGLPAVPDEMIPPGNEDTVRASGYGYRSYGDLMNPRQTRLFVETVRAIHSVMNDLSISGISPAYCAALAAYAAANLPRKIRYATRGAKLRSHGGPEGKAQNRVQVGDVFSDESKVSFNFDYVEAGPATGPGTWSSVSTSGLNALKKVLAESPGGKPGRFRPASAVALPFRDGTVDAVITDPPYYNMIDYGDASDIFYVWLRRTLREQMPDLFADAGGNNLQNKSEEIIVKRGGGPEEHRTRDFYEQMLSNAFTEARRVLRPDGHLVVVFGHSDPDAWRRLLGALHDAGFVVTSAWPSRTETAATGVASIKVTVTIGCRVASRNRPVATAAQVDREVVERVKAAARQWDDDGLALTDQLMAAYGPAMEVYGRHSAILKPDGTEAALDRYLTLSRTAVRDATALKLDEIPLETFDATTRFAVFWYRLFGRIDVPKGEARFLAQADNLRIEDLRGPLLTETKSGYRLRIDAPAEITARSSTFEVVRAMAAAWDRGATESVADIVATSEHTPTDAHLWAVVGELVAQLPPSDSVAKALTAVQRNASAIANLAQRVTFQTSADIPDQLTLSFPQEF